MDPINVNVAQPQQFPVNPPTQPGGLPEEFDFSAEIKKSLSDAEKSQKRARKMEMIGSILQGAGMLGNMVNGIYQTSNGRVPIDIGNPVMGMGALVGNMGQTYQNQANKTIAQGMMNSPNIPEKLRPLLVSWAASNPEKAMEKGFDVLNPKRSSLYQEFIDFFGREPTSEEDLRKLAEMKGRAQVSIGPGGGMFGGGAPKAAAPTVQIPEGN